MIIFIFWFSKYYRKTNRN